MKNKGIKVLKRQYMTYKIMELNRYRKIFPINVFASVWCEAISESFGLVMLISERKYISEKAVRIIPS